MIAAIMHAIKAPTAPASVEVNIPLNMPPSTPMTSTTTGQTVMMAMGGTAAIFLGLSGYALTTRKDFSYMGGFLTVGVLVAFLAGDARHPVVIGALWNGVDAPPETMDAGNNLRSITSRSGHRLLFDDSVAAEKVVLETQGGHRLTLDDAAGGTVTLCHSNGASVTIDVVGKVTVTAISEVAINAPAGMTVTAPTLRVQAAMADFTGVVRTSVLITGSVVSPTYTPGVGNLL